MVAVAELEIDRNKPPSPKALQHLVDFVPPDKVAKRIAQMLDAKLANGQPDWRAVEVAAKIYYAYTVGLPVQRQEVVQHRITSAPTATALLADPQGVETLLAEIIKTDAGKEAIKRLTDAQGKGV